MDKINYEFIKDIIELEKCSDHNESPKFIQTKDALELSLVVMILELER